MHGALTRSRSAPDAGAHAHDSREHSSEMTLISESAGKRDFCERQRRVAQQVLRAINASPEKPSMRGYSRRLAKGAGEMTGRQSAFLCELAERKLRGKVCIHRRFR